MIRRHPDIKLLRTAGDVQTLCRTQGQILRAVWPLVSPGGQLLYATCSLLPEENEQQVQGFLDSRKEARALPIDADWGHPRGVGRQTLPGEQGMDGFFYARIAKEQL